MTKVTMEDKGAPLIKKYKGFGAEGYGFIIIENDETEAQFKEKVTFNTFKGLQFLPPESGSAYDILVPPQGNKTMVIKCDPEGYSMASSTSTAVIQGEKNLAKMCLEKGTRKERPDPETGESHDIWRYDLNHSGGIAYLYVNKTRGRTLDETIAFQLQGLELEEKPGATEIDILVGPGQ